MRQFSEARWAGYKAQFGLTRRADDDRQLADGFSWLEGFPDRAKEDGMIKAAVAGDRLPPG
jgi:hypothetical protein